MLRLVFTREDNTWDSCGLSLNATRSYAEPALPRRLRELYDGDLRFPTSPARRPLVIGNFVSTLDGVVSYKIKGRSGGSTISGSDPADRFIMGLLRASADAIMVGAGSVHDVSPNDLWIPEYTYPAARRLYTEYRVNVMHKAEYPLVVVVSGSGRLELGRAIFRTPGVRTIVITTSAGQDELKRAGAAKLGSVQIHALNASRGFIAPLVMLRLLYLQFGVRRLLHEGGPRLFGQFLAAETVDELFLTLSPQIAGRSANTIRPAIVQAVEFTPAHAPWFRLLGVKQKAEHLYLRYRHTKARSTKRD
jgi:riboflavin biosynthesis pyrimidine reductase